MQHKKDCLAQVIIDCQRHGIKTADANKLPSYMHTPLKVGNFAFSADSHSTGVSVTVLLIHPQSDEHYTIIQGTWWYNEGQYGFNKFVWNHGKWDNALNDAIAELTSLLAERVAMHEAKDKEKAKLKADEEQSQKEKFEALY